MRAQRSGVLQASNLTKLILLSEANISPKDSIKTFFNKIFLILLE